MESQEQPAGAPESFEAGSFHSLAEEVPSQAASAENNGGIFTTFLSMVSSTFGLPLGFFQSRPEIRTWGEAEVQDPSIQPSTDGAPKNYGTGLPGYPKDTCAYLKTARGPNKRSPEFVSLFSQLDVHDDKLIGPRLSGFRKCKVDYPRIPADKLGTPTYDYRDLLGHRMDYHLRGATPRKFGSPTYDYRDLLAYKMDYHPYVNAIMNPQDPAGMYVRANWMVAYPYGVPAVEENERNQVEPLERPCC